MKHYVKVILWGEPVGYLECEDITHKCKWKNKAYYRTRF